MSETVVDPLLKPGEVAIALFGENNKSNRHRVIRMCESGSLRHVRLGERRDRYVPASEVGRLHAEAEDNARQAAERHAEARRLAGTTVTEAQAATRAARRAAARRAST